MKRYGGVFIVFFFLTNFIFAGQTKIINKSFKAEPDKTIEFDNFSGIDVKITSWDKNEIAINLRAYVDCSDTDYEILYANSLDVTNIILGSRQIINFEKTSEEGGSSFLGLFKVRFFYHFRSEIKGEIFLPRDMAVNLNFNYSDMAISGMDKIQEIKGRSNDMKIYDCSGINSIDNNYGKIILEKCTGNIELSSRSTSININDHKGDLKIVSDYTDIRLNNVLGKVSIRDRSGDIEIKNAVVQFLDIPYSDLEIRDMNPAAENILKIKGKSSSYSFYNIKSNLEIESDYTDVRFRNTKGDIYFDGKSCKVIGDNVTGNVEIIANYSNINFRYLSLKSLKVSSSNNTMSFDLITEPEQIDIKNKYGNIEIIMPRSFDGEIDLGTRYGKIKSDFDINLKTEKNDAFGYSKGKSSKKRIRIENYSSDILLRY